MDHEDDLADFSLEDFDRARHRLRQENAARDGDRTYLPAAWTGDQPPERGDLEMMARYNRCVIAEAANITRPIDWFKVAAWAVAGLFSLTVWAVAARWLR